jgi:hypothetical protein
MVLLCAFVSTNELTMFLIELQVNDLSEHESYILLFMHKEDILINTYPI